MHDVVGIMTGAVVHDIEHPEGDGSEPQPETPAAPQPQQPQPPTGSQP